MSYCQVITTCIWIYQGFHCCTKVCNLHLDVSSSKSRDNWMHWRRCNLLKWKGIYKNYEPFTDQFKPIYFTCNGLNKPIGFNYKLSKVWRIMLCNPMKAYGCLGKYSHRAGQWPVIGWKHLGGPWPLSHFYRELSSGCIRTVRVVIQSESSGWTTCWYWWLASIKVSSHQYRLAGDYDQEIGHL